MLKPPKLYCPFCELELSGHRHKSEVQAWTWFNCEYNKLIDEKPPLTELALRRKRLADLEKERLRLTKNIKATKARIAELESYSTEES